MGQDTVMPFLAYEGKWVVMLGLTSNESAAELQMLMLADGHRMFERVIETSMHWGHGNDIGLVHSRKSIWRKFLVD